MADIPHGTIRQNYRDQLRAEALLGNCPVCGRWSDELVQKQIRAYATAERTLLKKLEEAEDRIKLLESQIEA